MPRLEAAAGERDHQRIVAGQEDVDPDDLADRDPEGRFGHLNAELGEECPDRSGIEDLPEPVHTTSFPPRLVTLSADGSADDLVAREELRDLDRSGFRRIRTVRGVLADRLCIELADGAVSRLGRIGRPHHVAILGDGTLAFQHLDHHGARGHEVHELTEEGARLMDRIEGLGLFLGHADALLRDDAQARLLDHGVNRTGKVTRGGVGLDDREGAFDGHDLVLEEKTVVRSCRAYIGAFAIRQATAKTDSWALRRRPSARIPTWITTISPK